MGVCAVMIIPPCFRSVFRGSRVRCVFDRRGRDRPHACALDSELVLEFGLNGLARSDAHGNTSAQTMLSVSDFAAKIAQNATLILLREMQRCTDSVKRK